MIKCKPIAPDQLTHLHHYWRKALTFSNLTPCIATLCMQLIDCTYRLSWPATRGDAHGSQVERKGKGFTPKETPL